MILAGEGMKSRDGGGHCRCRAFGMRAVVVRPSAGRGPS